MKQGIFSSIVGVSGSVIVALFGGWSASLTTLLIFMGMDIIAGLIVAGLFHKSNKSKTGSLDSKAGWKGLARKGVTLLIVIVAHRLDMLIGSSYIKDAVCIAFITNEAISLLENAGLMGIPIPKFLTKAIDVLKDRNEG